MDWFMFVVAALAAYRISTLVVQDEITAELREWWWRRFPVSEFVYDERTNIVGNKDGDTVAKAWPFKRLVIFDDDWGWVPVNVYKLGQLIECVYCVSVWAAAGVTAVIVGFDQIPLGFEFLIYLLGVAGAAEILNSKLGRE